MVVPWAKWCLPCVGELVELAKHHSELASSGISVVLLNLDQNDDRVAAEVDELQAVIENESAVLAELIEKTRGELGKLVAKETGRLEQQKVATKDLAILLTDVAKRLKDNGK